MIKELKQMQEKYKQIAKMSDYVSTQEVVSDIYYLIKDARLKRTPKGER